MRALCACIAPCWKPAAPPISLAIPAPALHSTEINHEGSNERKKAEHPEGNREWQGYKNWAEERVIKKDHREDLWGNKTLKNGTCRKI
jgi:hypothetical protein